MKASRFTQAFNIVLCFSTFKHTCSNTDSPVWDVFVSVRHHRTVVCEVSYCSTTLNSLLSIIWTDARYARFLLPREQSMMCGVGGGLTTQNLDNMTKTLVSLDMKLDQNLAKTCARTSTRGGPEVYQRWTTPPTCHILSGGSRVKWIDFCIVVQQESVLLSSIKITRGYPLNSLLTR